MTIADIFNLGLPDLLIILVIVLLLFGAKKLPPLGRGMGDALREFRRAFNEFRDRFCGPSGPVEMSNALLKLLVILALVVFVASLADRFSR